LKALTEETFGQKSALNETYGGTLMAFIILIVIGLVTGWLVGSFTEGRGLGLAWNVVIGIIGSVLGGFLFGMVGERLVGPGPVFMASMLAGAVGAVVLVLLVRLVKK